MDETSPAERDGVSKLSRRGLLALGATLAGTSGIGMFSGSAAAHELMAFRDAFVGDDADKQGLGSKGWLFFAKNTGTVYYHNGSGWVDLGIGGGEGGSLADDDDDGLLEAPDHDGIDVGQVEAESVSAGDATIGSLAQTGNEFTISDDSVVSFSPANGQALLRIVGDGNAGFHATRFNSLDSGAMVQQTNQGNSTLSGATGPEGSLNVARDRDDVLLENRLGQEVDVSAQVISMG